MVGDDRGLAHGSSPPVSASLVHLELLREPGGNQRRITLARTCLNCTLSHAMSSPRNTSPPNSPSNADGWQKPIKVARRRLSEMSSGDAIGDDATIRAKFSALGPLNDDMDLSLEGEQGL